MATSNMTIGTIALEVIRDLGQTVEAIGGSMAVGSGFSKADHAMLGCIEKLSDRIEHIAQYCLSNDDVLFQKQCLLQDIAVLGLFLSEYRGVLCETRPWALPTDEALKTLASDAAAIVG